MIPLYKTSIVVMEYNKKCDQTQILF